MARLRALCLPRMITAHTSATERSFRSPWTTHAPQERAPGRFHPAIFDVWQSWRCQATSLTLPRRRPVPGTGAMLLSLRNRPFDRADSSIIRGSPFTNSYRTTRNIAGKASRKQQPPFATLAWRFARRAGAFCRPACDIDILPVRPHYREDCSTTGPVSYRVARLEFHPAGPASFLPAFLLRPLPFGAAFPRPLVLPEAEILSIG